MGINENAWDDCDRASSQAFGLIGFIRPV